MHHGSNRASQPPQFFLMLHVHDISTYQVPDNNLPHGNLQHPETSATMDASSSVSVYRPLAAGEIRLLRLRGGKPTDPISCTLSHQSLSAESKYEALSYVWGDPSRTFDILVDGCRFTIRQNLLDALKQFRHKLKERVLWADAICINQDDVAEKDVQVPLMREIYSDASSVIIWLGPSNPNIELAISWWKTYTLQKYSIASIRWLKLQMACVFSDQAKIERYLVGMRALEGYYDIFNAPYWNRMWTFQEYKLAGKEPICWCGKLAINVMELSQHVRTIQTKLLGDEMAREKLYARLSEPKRARHIERIRPVTAEKSYPGMRTAGFMWNLREVWPYRLNFLLLYTKDRRCFDPRDKIYALSTLR